MCLWAQVPSRQKPSRWRCPPPILNREKTCLGRDSGAPARWTSHDHQQNQMGREKGENSPWGERGYCEGRGRPASPADRHVSCLICLNTETGQPQGHALPVFKWGSRNDEASDFPGQWHDCEEQPMREDPDPTLGPPACCPKSSSSRWLCGL